jgi:cell division protein FtsI (penicillin-binding protein 3)
MKQLPCVKQFLFRLCFVGVTSALILTVLFWRVLDLTVLHRQFLKIQGDARSIRIVSLPAHRGMILDRNGAPLAISSLVQSIWINPKQFNATPQQFNKLIKLLHLTEQLKTKITAFKKREFLYLKRQVMPDIANQIKELKITGLYLQPEYKRFYPEADSISQLIGFTNIDDHGIEGLELLYQQWLEGVPGKKKVLKDRSGHIIDELGIIKPAKPGNDLQISIDRRIQYIAYHELLLTLKQYQAKSGSIIVLDTKTGELLAVANAPSYNPNARAAFARGQYRNRAFTDLFEPGSVIKPFSIASALEARKITPNTIIDTNPSWMVVHGRRIQDIHNYGVLNVTGILQHSSNVGVSKIALMSPPSQLINFFSKVGLASSTDLGYPGESNGTMVGAREADPFVLATLSFGYGISVTAVQLAKAYMVLANFGQAKPITLLKNNTEPKSENIINSNVAIEVMNMLEAVLANEGTGRAARVAGYRVAGKTGTARIAEGHGYAKNRHIASFVGIAPASKPRLVVAVIINEPSKNGYYAAAVAAPLFAKVMAGALRIMDIQPDDQ